MVAYNRDIPDTPNNPSNDQPKMKINTNSIDDILGVDHISFNANSGGTHLQNSYVNFSTGTVIGGTPASVAYPAAGVADATRAQYYFKNSTNNFLLSGIRAFAYAIRDTINAGQSSNIQSIVRNSAGKYTVTLTANSTSSSDYLILISSERTSNTSMSQSYTITSTTTFDLFFNFPITNLNVDPNSYSFIVIQI